MDHDLTEEVLAPAVVIRFGPGTTLSTGGDDDGRPIVGVTEGAVWARAEEGSVGIDLSHGAVNAVVTAGTAVLDARGGSGVLLSLRGRIEISTGGIEVMSVAAGEAITFDGSGAMAVPTPLDPAELASDRFVALNLVLDALEVASVPSSDGATEDPFLDRDDSPTPLSTADARAEAGRLRGRGRRRGRG